MNNLLIIIVVLFVTSCGSENKQVELKDSLVNKGNEFEKIIAQKDSILITENSEILEEEDGFSKEIIWKNSMRAYIFDPDSGPTNVRETPSGDIIITLAKDKIGHEVFIFGVTRGWFFVSSISSYSDENIEEIEVEGFIHGSVLAVGTRNYGGEEINLFTESNESSAIVATINQETQLTLRNSNDSGDWIFVRWNNEGDHVEGWIKKEWLCGSLVTNCS